MAVNIFEEGGDAYRKWLDDSFRLHHPESPYTPGTVEDREWETGFNDAMNWQLYGQYEVD
jgi:hypothetical protein